MARKKKKKNSSECTLHKYLLTQFPQKTNTRCRLLELPPEIREEIWTLSVVEYEPSPSQDHVDGRVRSKRAVRIDKLNKPLPPAITRTCQQIRSETLHLYYQRNVFECWRPMNFSLGFTGSILVTFLDSLGPKIKELKVVQLLYKQDHELNYDVREVLSFEGYDVDHIQFSHQLQLTEYELRHEELGLPRSFGKKYR